MRISIDSERCQGHGRCWDIAPELLDADDRGYGIVRDPDGAVPTELESRAHDIASACPEQAIVLTE